MDVGEGECDANFQSQETSTNKELTQTRVQDLGWRLLETKEDAFFDSPLFQTDSNANLGCEGGQLGLEQLSPTHMFKAILVERVRAV